MDTVPAGRLPPNSVFRSLAGRAAYHAYYDRIVARLPFPAREVDVATSFGRTHLTIGGTMDAPPLLVLPGMSIAGPLMLEFIAVLAGERRLIAPDLIGHPGRSEDRIHPTRDHGFGRWLVEVLDELGIEKVDILSGSFGSSAGLDLAAVAPQRAGKQVLLMPAGLTPQIPYIDIYRRFLVPWLIYRALPDRRRLPAIAAPLASAFSANDFDYLDLIVRETMFWRHRPAGPFLPRDFKGYREPVFLVTAGRDFIFPRGPTRANAIAALNVTEEVYLPDSTHVPDAASMVEVNQKIAEFLRS